MQLEVLFADDDLIIINKPAGLPTLPDGYKKDAPYVGSLLKPVYGRIYFVHRLDKETSGALALARNPETHRALNTQFEQRQTNKVYHALVLGSPEWDEKRIDVPLLPDADRRHRTWLSDLGKPAVTNAKVLERYQGYCLVEAQPETGRTHQIRVHLAYWGLPILGDELYGDEEAVRPEIIERIALHAFELKLEHPRTGEEMTFQAPYPEDFERALALLRHK